MLQSEGKAVDGDPPEPDLLNVEEEKRDFVSDIAHKSNDFFNSLSRKYRLFGRQEPIHHVLGAGNSADILLWRKKQMTISILAGVTTIWLLFECIGYHLITFICHSLILSLSTLFLCSNLAAFSGLSPPKIPEVKITEDELVKMALLLRNEFNTAYKTFQEVASKQDIKTFLLATGILWILSIVGNWFNFLTLLYLFFVMALTLPMLYEKHEDQVDSFAEKGLNELKKQYAILDEKFLHKLPILSGQKQHRS